MEHENVLAFALIPSVLGFLFAWQEMIRAGLRYAEVSYAMGKLLEVLILIILFLSIAIPVNISNVQNRNVAEQERLRENEKRRNE